MDRGCYVYADMRVVARGKYLLCALWMLAALPSMSCAGKADQREASDAQGGSNAGYGGVGAAAGSPQAGRAGCQAYNYTSLTGACSQIGESVQFKGEVKGCQLLGGQQTDCPNKTCLCRADGTWWCACPCFLPYTQHYGFTAPGVSCSCVDNTGTCSIPDPASGGDGGTLSSGASAGDGGAPAGEAGALP
jgi:hypothetical protein